MATHDYVIANQSGAAFRADLNNALTAIVTNNSSSSEPATKYAYQWWADTNLGVMKIRNSSNNGWVELFNLDGKITLADGAASTPSLAFRDDLNTGVFSSAADTFDITAGGTVRLTVTTSGISVNGTASVTGDLSIADKIVHTGDTNTAIRFSAGDTIKLETGGVERVHVAGSTIFNETGANVDFRVEGNNDANLLFLDAGNDRCGIGTSSPNAKLTVVFDSANTGNVQPVIIPVHTSTGTTTTGFGTSIRFQMERADGAIQTSGDIQSLADVNTTSNLSAALVFKPSNSGSPAERMRITSDGKVGIATSTPTETLFVSGTAQVSKFKINDSNDFHNSGKFQIKGHSTGSHTLARFTDSAGNQVFIVRCDGFLQISGGLVKGSGSFKIDHPLPSLAKTKTLAHSFIEGPRCDNIYRGKIALSSGTATVNLDLVSKMTEGTFVALNRDTQCFTTNETSFSSVKGSVSGNILTITSEDSSSTDTISWLVIGERQDPNIKSSSITDNDGYLIVESAKVAA